MKQIIDNQEAQVEEVTEDYVLNDEHLFQNVGTCSYNAKKWVKSCSDATEGLEEGCLQVETGPGTTCKWTTEYDHCDGVLKEQCVFHPSIKCTQFKACTDIRSKNYLNAFKLCYGEGCRADTAGALRIGQGVFSMIITFSLTWFSILLF